MDDVKWIVRKFHQLETLTQLVDAVQWSGFDKCPWCLCPTSMVRATGNHYDGCLYQKHRDEELEGSL